MIVCCFFFLVVCIFLSTQIHISKNITDNKYKERKTTIKKYENALDGALCTVAWLIAWWPPKEINIFLFRLSDARIPAHNTPVIRHKLTMSLFLQILFYLLNIATFHPDFTFMCLI